MVRYFMHFTVPEDDYSSAIQVIKNYFDFLKTSGPGGMRSQCYITQEDDCNFVHIKSFKKESVANQHFKSEAFKNYLAKIKDISGQPLSFCRLQQQQTFESIY